MIKFLSIILCFAVLQSHSSVGREWKNSDGTKSFVADFVTLNQNVAELSTLTGKGLKIHVSKLSPEDQKWLGFAAKVVSLSKKSVGLRVILSAKEGDRLVRLAHESNRISSGSDPYQSDFAILEGTSPRVGDLGVTETKVLSLYWAGTKSITVSQSEMTSLSRDLWTDWYNLYSNKTTILTVYHLSIESAVDAYLAREKATKVNEKNVEK